MALEIESRLIGWLGGATCFVLAGLSPTAALADFTGNQLYAACKGSATLNPVQWGICHGYISGTVDGLRIAAKTFDKPAFFCEPDGVTNGQLGDIVILYLHNRPELRHEQASELVWNAMLGAFPCPKGQNGPLFWFHFASIDPASPSLAWLRYENHAQPVRISASRSRSCFFLLEHSSGAA